MKVSEVKFLGAGFVLPGFPGFAGVSSREKVRIEAGRGRKLRASLW